MMTNRRDNCLALVLICGLIFTASAVHAKQDTDKDRDGLTLTQEKALGTNPKKYDTDKDGLPDGIEVYLTGTNPRARDSDRDGLTDLQEVWIGTNPLDADSDDDGVKDGKEQKQGTDPSDADTDNDGFIDSVDYDPGEVDKAVEFELKGYVEEVNDECLLYLSSGLFPIDASGAEIEGVASCADLDGKKVEADVKVIEGILEALTVEVEN